MSQKRTNAQEFDPAERLKNQNIIYPFEYYHFFKIGFQINKIRNFANKLLDKRVYRVYEETMNSKKIIKKLEAAGFEKVHARGSHLKLKHPDGRMVVVPHPKKDTPLGTIINIERITNVRIR